MKKKIFVILLIFFWANCVYTQNLTDFEFKENEGKLTITRYKGSATAVKIPERINGKLVVAIGDLVFVKNYEALIHGEEDNPIGVGITSIIIPESVTDIGICAFACNQLTQVTIPNGVTSIGKSAFANNQLVNINIPNSVTYIESYAFYGNKLTSVNIGNCVEEIGAYAFASNQLTSVTIPNSITYIGQGAFNNNKLTSLTIPRKNIFMEGISINELNILAQKEANFFQDWINNQKRTGNINYTSMIQGVVEQRMKTSNFISLITIYSNNGVIMGSYLPDQIGHMLKDAVRENIYGENIEDAYNAVINAKPYKITSYSPSLRLNAQIIMLPFQTGDTNIYWTIMIGVAEAAINTYDYIQK